MKTLLCSLILAGFTLPMTVACTETVAESNRTKRNWDGTVTQERTSVQENKITGDTTVEKAKSRY